MITELNGNIFNSTCDGLVNPVNCIGVMGKGLALEFKKRYPLNFKAYYDECKANRLRPGIIFTFNEAGKLIINFPTKVHWREQSSYEYIEAGLQALKMLIKKQYIKSIAIPKLGCGLGGLNWPIIRSIMINNLYNIDIDIVIYI